MQHVLVILVFLLVTPITVVAAAEEAAVPAESVETQIKERVEAAKERLGLTDAQLDQIRPIIAASIEGQREVFAKYGIAGQGDVSGLSFREKRKLRNDVKALRKSTSEQLAEVLSDEQMRQYEALAEERRSALRERAAERSN